VRFYRPLWMHAPLAGLEDSRGTPKGVIETTRAGSWLRHMGPVAHGLG